VVKLFHSRKKSLRRMANATGAPTDEVVPGETGAEDGCIYFTMEDASRW
jgi:hypothetical protein